MTIPMLANIYVGKYLLSFVSKRLNRRGLCVNRGTTSQYFHEALSSGCGETLQVELSSHQTGMHAAPLAPPLALRSY